MKDHTNIASHSRQAAQHFVPCNGKIPGTFVRKPRLAVTTGLIFIVFMLATACSRQPSGQAGPSPFGEDPSLHWYEQPLRILQTVLREIDGKDYDAQSVIRHMKETNSNVLVVNAGGIVDFFDNPLPAGTPNRFLGPGEDVLRDIVRACHENGFKVIARVDFRGVREEIYNQYPDWFARDANGNPITLTYTRIPLYIPCYDSHYRNAHALEFLHYLMENYNVDGIWHNSVQVYSMCYCDECTRLYDEAHGTPIPVQGRSSKAEMDRYFEWKTTRASNHMQTMREKVKEFGDDRVYVAEVFGMYDVSGPINTGIDLYSARDHFDFLVSVNFLTENRREIEYKNLGYSASIIRFLKALDPSRQPVILFGQNGTSHRYVMEPDIDSRVFLWQAIASGGSLWNCSFTGQHPGATYDRRNAHLMSDFNRFIEQEGRAFRNTVPSADVMIYYSKSTRIHFGSDNPSNDRFGSAIQGIERMCRDNHIQYGFFPDENLSAERLKNVKVLVMPNAASISDREADIIREYVRDGGRLLATFETSLYDETGRRRDDFALADIFGVSHTGVTMDTQMDCYQWINDHGLILTERMRDTRMLINSGQTLLTGINSPQARTVCSYMPRITNQSPEMAWDPEEEMTTDHPTVVVNSFGNGKSVYFANQPDRMNYLMGHPDFCDLLHGAVRHLLDGETIVSTNAPASVNVWVNETPGLDRYVVSLVNATGGPERPRRSISPVYDIEVTINLPPGKKWNSRVLRKEGNVKVARRGDRVTLRVGRIDEFVSVALWEDL
jgi:hypothetical protein